MSGLLLKVICNHQGALDYDNLVDIGYGLDLIDTLDTLLENNELFSVHMFNGLKRVVAKTNVRRCRAPECQGCKDVHLCKFYLLGNCSNSRGRRTCRFGHNLHSEHNSGVLREHQLDTLSREELCQLLLQNDNSFLPPVCGSYNKGAGPYGNCPDQESCKRLHVCERYIKDTCASGISCTRSHDFFEPHPLKTLQQRGVPNSLVPSLQSTYQNIQALKNEQNTASKSYGKPPSGQRRETVNDEICMFFVKGDCKQGDKCVRAHCKLPYRWEVKLGHSWVVLPNNEAIEKDFCDPSKTHSEGEERVRFDSMTLGLNEVRRLSTLSSVVKPAYVLTTQWAWYWLDEYGRWVQYASIKEMHRMSTITSEDLEKRYQEDKSAVVQFSAGQGSFELSFQDMTQRNIQRMTAKTVRRRPVFVSSSDAHAARSRSNGPRNVHHFKAVPGFWDKSAIPDIGYKVVPLPSSERDYQKVQELFARTMGGFRITSIQRVQNRDLWEIFQWKRELMKKNNGVKNSRERLLFHGTDPKHVDAICRDNFDWRLCGTNGTVYGEGSYFARDANYSHSYTGQSGGRSMFVCRVLVGDYTRGSSNLRRPPPKGEEDLTLYDSCVDDACNPSIYVVFEKHQVYPEFLIRYDDATRNIPSLAILPTSSNRSASLIPVPKPRTTSPLSSDRKAPTPFSKPTQSMPSLRPSKPATVSLKRSPGLTVPHATPTTQLVDTKQTPTTQLVDTKQTPTTQLVDTKQTPTTQLVDTKQTPTTQLVDTKRTPTTQLVDTKQTPTTQLVDTKQTPTTQLVDTKQTPTSSSDRGSDYWSKELLMVMSATDSEKALSAVPTLSLSRDTLTSIATTTATTPASIPSRALSTPASTSSLTLITPASTSSLRLIAPASTSSPALITAASTSSRTLTLPVSTSSLTAHASTSSHALTLPATTSTTAHSSTSSLTTHASTSSLTAHSSTSSLTTHASTSSLTAHSSTSSLTTHASTSSLTTHASTSSLTAHTSTSSRALITRASTSSRALITPVSTSSRALITPASTSSRALITSASTSSRALITSASTSSPTLGSTVSHPLASSSTQGTPHHTLSVSGNPAFTPSPSPRSASSLSPVYSPSTGALSRPLSSPTDPSTPTNLTHRTSPPPKRNTNEKNKCILQ